MNKKKMLLFIYLFCWYDIINKNYVIINVLAFLFLYEFYQRISGGLLPGKPIIVTYNFNIYKYNIFLQTQNICLNI